MLVFIILTFNKLLENGNKPRARVSKVIRKLVALPVQTVAGKS